MLAGNELKGIVVMKKKEKNAESKSNFMFLYILGSLVATVLSFLFLPAIMEKGTDIIYNMLNDKEEDL